MGPEWLCLGGCVRESTAKIYYPMARYSNNELENKVVDANFYSSERTVVSKQCVVDIHFRPYFAS